MPTCRARSRLPGLSPRRPHGPASISIPAFAGLASQLAGLDPGLELRRRPVALVAGDLEHVLARVVGDVEAAEVTEAKRPHRPVETLLDGRVDVLERRDARIEQPVSLLRRGVEDAIDDEAVD